MESKWSDDRMEMAKWTEEDKLLKLSDQLENVALVESVPFHNYLEEWETLVLSTRNDESFCRSTNLYTSMMTILQTPDILVQKMLKLVGVFWTSNGREGNLRVILLLHYLVVMKVILMMTMT